MKRLVNWTTWLSLASGLFYFILAINSSWTWSLVIGGMISMGIVAVYCTFIIKATTKGKEKLDSNGVMSIVGASLFGMAWIIMFATGYYSFTLFGGAFVLNLIILYKLSETKMSWWIFLGSTFIGLILIFFWTNPTALWFAFGFFIASRVALINMMYKIAEK